MRKIDYAIGAAGVFISHMHREGFDRGMIATFGDRYRVEQSLTSTERFLHTALSKIKPNGRTRLYDSIEDVIRNFWNNGDRDRPWVLIIITDGIDNKSRKYKNDPEGIGYYIAKYFNHEKTNYIYLIGVGEGEHINEDALIKIGKVGGFPAYTINAFPLLEYEFMKIALKISGNLTGVKIEAADFSWEHISQLWSISQIPIDYAFLLDRSGSMDDPGD